VWWILDFNIVKKLFISLILMIASASAFANAPTMKYFLTTASIFDTRDALCSSVGMVVVQGEGGNAGNYFCVNSGSPWWSGSTIGSGYFCDGGALPDTTKAFSEQCPSPPPPVCTGGVSGSGTWNIGSATCVSSKSCSGPPIGGGSNGSCEINITSVTQCYTSAGSMFCEYVYTQTGNQKPAGSPEPTGGAGMGANDPRVNMPPTSAGSTGSCPDGSVSGGIDSGGVPICIGTGTAPKNTPSKTVTTSAPSTVTNGDGSTTTTQTKTSSNVDGSSTTTTTTTNTATNGTVTTSSSQTTSAAPGGAITGKEDRPEEASDLCKLHPELTVCRNSSVSGSCGQIACTGDAIQCATLRAVAAADCRANDDKAALLASSSYGAGNGILSGADPQQGAINSLMAGSSVDLSSSALDQSGFLGGGSCFGDKTFMVSGHVVTVSFTTVCNNITPLRYIILACSLMAAYMLVSKSILQG
jgi:hypothetical protein